jgi:glycosyltransferase involved in cell wall biosynthesis
MGISKMTPWILVAGDFKSTGGMDKANRMLASFLLERGTPVHFVAHFVEPELASHSLATVHRVRRPLNSYVLGSPLLDLVGRRIWRKLKRNWPAAVIVANGGNCLAAGVNWAHFVHGAWKPDLAQAGWPYRLRWLLEHTWECYRERQAYRAAGLVLTNSQMTAHDVVRCSGRTDRKVVTVYLGGEAEWGAVSDSERLSRRLELGIPVDKKLALFVGALSSDNRKGLDVILGAWKSLRNTSTWDVDLWIAGAGPVLSNWQSYVTANGLQDKVKFLGFRKDIPELLAASDLLISVPRYEPYGLNVQEALARGISVITSVKSGIAERFPSELQALLVTAPESVAELSAKLILWRNEREHWKHLCMKFGKVLCEQSWTSMAEEIVAAVETGFLMPRQAAMVELLNKEELSR